MELEDGTKLSYIVRYGSVRRVMETGAKVEINGFYFEMEFPRNELDKVPRFSVVNNWAGLHDLDITEVVGNIFQK